MSSVTEDLLDISSDKDFQENGKGHPIEFYEIWEALYGHALRDHTYVPLDFRFWLVPERMNQEAYIIADCRLNPEMHDLGNDYV